MISIIHLYSLINPLKIFKDINEQKFFFGFKKKKN